MKADSGKGDFELFIQKLKASLNQELIQEHKNLDTEIRAIIDFIEDQSYFREKFLEGYPIRVQKKQNKVFVLTGEKIEFSILADQRKIPYSFEFGQSYLHILVKTKRGKFSVAGSSKKFKDCISFQNDRWQLWVNGTHKNRTDENKLSQNFPSQYVQKNFDGVPYVSGVKTKYSTYSVKARHGDLIDYKATDIVQLFSIIASATLDLSVIHSLGMIHRDVKSDNILIFIEDEIPVAKLTDFGNTIKVQDAHLQKGVCGTLENVSPSLILGHDLLERLSFENLQKMATQSAIISDMKAGKIAEIKPSRQPSIKDDIYALVNTAYRHLFLFKSKSSFSTPINSEIQLLLDYFNKIRMSSPEIQPGTEEILQTILATITNLSKLMPDPRWEKIIKYCKPEKEITADLEVKQTSSVTIPKDLQFIQKKIEVSEIKSILQTQHRIIERIILTIEKTEYKIIFGAKKIHTQTGAQIKVSQGAAIIYQAATTLKKHLPVITDPSHRSIQEFLACLCLTLHDKDRERTMSQPASFFNRRRCPGVTGLYQFLEQQYNELQAAQVYLSRNGFKSA